MEANGSEIDVYAIGTHIATCKKQPALGLVCKLTEINNIPRMKFSSDPDKATLPGNKTVYRAWTDQSDKSTFDLITLGEEELELGENTLYTLSKQEEVKHKIVKVKKMNEDLNVFEFSKTLIESKQYLRSSMKELPERIFSLSQPSKHEVLLTPKFLEAFKKARDANKLENE